MMKFTAASASFSVFGLVEGDAISVTRAYPRWPLNLLPWSIQMLLFNVVRTLTTPRISGAWLENVPQSEEYVISSVESETTICLAQGR